VLFQGSFNPRSSELNVLAHTSISLISSYHLPMPDPSPSNVDGLKLPISYSSEGAMASHSGQFTPSGYLSAVAGIEPTTFDC